MSSWIQPYSKATIMTEGGKTTGNNNVNGGTNIKSSAPETNRNGCFSRLFCCTRNPSPTDLPYEQLERDGRPSVDEYTSLLGSYPPLSTNRIPPGLQIMNDNDQLNLWNEPFDPSHTECEEDMKLFKLIQCQERTKAGSSQWQQYDLEINKIRQKRMDIQENWKVILRGLGFIDEVENGIMSPVSSHAKSHSNITKSVQARDMLDKLVKESSIFVGHRAQAQSQRYLTIMERLIDLETADDFVEASIELFPPRNRNLYSDTEEEG